MLLKAVIIIFILIIFCVFGMRVMGGIDDFIAGGGLSPENPDSGRECALVFGNSKRNRKICTCLRRYGIEVIEVETVTFLKEWEHIHYVIAASESDLDNLSICNLSNRFYQLRYMAGVCNEDEHLILYKKAGIQTVHTQEDCIESLRECLAEGSAAK